MSAPVSTRENLKQRLQQVTGDDLLRVHRVLEQQFRNPNAFVQELCEHVARYQGKRIRPMILLLSARMAGADAAGMSVGVKLGAVVEMIHTATLVHDDVIDDADLRRHVSTVHRRWNTETSVLLGDYLFSRAFHLAATTGDAEACRLIGRATDRTCEGELNQIAARIEQSTSERDYFRVISGKTGQLFSVSCRLGGRVAGASEKGMSHLRQFGMRLGLAFQIADDVLDLTENSQTTGKDAANDLNNHRLTLPLLRSLALGDDFERRKIRESLLSSDPADHQRLRTSSVVQRGVESARQTAEELVRRACRNLHFFPPSDSRDLLESIAMFSVVRSH
ncbi:MAG: polyprenyl synthetase family protein [Planctomyces sp.]|nr:polyprenyl synthetase family protein [Planctomyces sp.]